ncbi:MAG: DUF5666 domain-containing protein [Janthinobacterium lividum]
MQHSLKLQGLAALLALSAASFVGAQTSSTAPASGSTNNLRGTIHSVDANSLQIDTISTGTVTVAIHAPFTVYSASPSDLSHVHPNSFVGVTSVRQHDGSELAKEIHIFPEALRGTGEGSHIMDAANGGPSGNRMTNGSISATQKPSNGPSGSRMTNGTVSKQAGGTALTVDYGSGSKAITVPPTVTVTEIAATNITLKPGDRVFVLANKSSDGKLWADKAMLASPPRTAQSAKQ